MRTFKELKKGDFVYEVDLLHDIFEPKKVKVSSVGTDNDLVYVKLVDRPTFITKYNTSHYKFGYHAIATNLEEIKQDAIELLERVIKLKKNEIESIVKAYIKPMQMSLFKLKEGNKKNKFSSQYNDYLTNGHDYVEIGGVKWATKNIGAKSETDAGLYFQWGDTQGYTAAQVGSGEGQKAFTWADYKFNPSGDGETMTKYNNEDELTTLESADDAVTAAWGGNWRMPTQDEFFALGDVVETAWTQVNGVSGMMCTVTADTADNGKQLFFPACGLAYNGSIYNVGIRGGYWHKTFDPYDGNGVDSAYCLTFESNRVDWDNYYGSTRDTGYLVRGVLADA